MTLFTIEGYRREQNSRSMRFWPHSMESSARSRNSSLTHLLLGNILKNWDWQLVISLDRGSCERGKALHGKNSEAHEKVQEWEGRRSESLTLGQTLGFPQLAKI